MKIPGQISAEINTQAAALSGSGVETLELDPDATKPRAGWYVRENAYRLRRRNGIIVQVPCQCDRHPDNLVDRLRWHVCIGGVVQAIGRGRGTRRTADRPLDVYVLTDVPLPMLVDEFLLASDCEPSVEDLQIADGGVAFENGASAAAAYPNLWSGAGAFRSAKLREAAQRRDESPNTPSRKSSVADPYYIPIRKCDAAFPKRPIRTILFQLAGNGQREQSARYHVGICTDPRAFIEARVGPLASCLVEEDEAVQPAGGPGCDGVVGDGGSATRDCLNPTGPILLHDAIILSDRRSGMHDR